MVSKYMVAKQTGNKVHGNLFISKRRKRKVHGNLQLVDALMVRLGNLGVKLKAKTGPRQISSV